MSQKKCYCLGWWWEGNVTALLTVNKRHAVRKTDIRHSSYTVPVEKSIRIWAEMSLKVYPSPWSSDTGISNM